MASSLSQAFPDLPDYHQAAPRITLENSGLHLIGFFFAANSDARAENT
jgi:hypothetical protein